MNQVTTRTWTFGTVKHGMIVQQAYSGFVPFVIFHDDTTPHEMFILTGQKELAQVREGDQGTITFTRGGPTGGYWHWTPVAKMKGEPR